MHLDRHAEQRCIQRRLPVDVLSTIYAFGVPRHAKGTLSLTLDEQTITLASEGDRHSRAKLERYRGAYIIVGDSESIVTVARRSSRHRR